MTAIALTSAVFAGAVGAAATALHMRHQAFREDNRNLELACFENKRRQAVVLTAYNLAFNTAVWGSVHPDNFKPDTQNCTLEGFQRGFRAMSNSAVNRPR